MPSLNSLTTYAKKLLPSLFGSVGSPGYQQTGDTDWSPSQAALAVVDDMQNLTNGQLLIGYSATAALTAPSAAPVLTGVNAAGATLPLGTYSLVQTYTNTFGETTQSPTGSVTLTGTQNRITVGAITPPSGASVNTYMSQSAGSATLRLVASGGSGASFNIDAVPSGTAVQPPTTNTTASYNHPEKGTITGANGVAITTGAGTIQAALSVTGDVTVTGGATKVTAVQGVPFYTVAPTAGQVPAYNATNARVEWAAPASVSPSGAAGGDLGGTYPNPSVAKVNGVAVTGTPTAGQIPTATSGTAAAWQTPTASGLVLDNLTADPATPATGRTYLNTTTNRVKSFISAAWQNLVTDTTAHAGDVTGTVGATVVGKVNGVAVSGTPAVNKYLVGSSGTAAAWGDLTLAGYTADPATPAVGLTYLNTTSNKVRAYINAAWQDIITSATAVGGDVTGTVGAITLPAKGTAGTYAYPASVTTDAKGAVTAVTAGSQPVTAVAVTGPVGNSGTSLAPNITWNPAAAFSNNGQQVTNFVLEQATADPVGATARAYVNTTANTFKIYLASAWKTIATTDAVVNSITFNAPFGNSGTATAPVPTLALTTTNDGGAIIKQAAYPGTQQTGNGNISGTFNAGSALQIGGNNLNPVPKNWLINGNMDVCQRYGPGGSASVGTAKAYVLDRWAATRDGTGATVTVSQQAFTLGQTAVPGEPTYFLRVAQSVAGSGSTASYLRQFIEDVRTLAGQQVTLSFWAKADAARTLNVQFRQYFGTGGTPSTDVVSSATACNLTTSWQKFTVTLTLGSLSGTTRGTNGDDALIVEFSLPLNVIQTIDFAQGQLEAGANAGPFQKKSLLDELKDCYRYYRKCFLYSVAPANSQYSGALLGSLPAVLSGTFYLPSISLGVPLRISPVTASCAFYNPAGGTAGQAYNFTRANSSTAISINTSGSSETVIAFQVTAFPVGWTANDLFSVGWAIDVEL